MSKSSKLTKLKEWLTVPDAARYLSVRFEEPVAEADILRLALDGHMKLSVRFVNYTHARRATPPLTAEEAARLFREFEASAHGAARQRNDPQPEREPIVTLGDTIVFDLPMVGGERLDVEHAYQRFTGGAAVTLINIDGAFVEGPDGTRYQLQERAPGTDRATGGNVRTVAGYIPSGGLPPDAVLVVRPSELDRVVNGISDSDRPLGARERDNHLAIIAALCQLAKLDLTKPTHAAEAIAAETEKLGHSVSVRKLLELLKEIRDLYVRKE